MAYTTWEEAFVYRNVVRKRMETKRIAGPPDHAYGCLPGRRREGAIATQLVMRHRLRARGITRSTDLYDVANAFP